MLNITLKKIEAFRKYLSDAEKTTSTVETYIYYIKLFMRWLHSNGLGLSKDAVIGWKNDQKARGLATSTINLRITALNRLFKFLGREVLCVQKFKVQNKGNTARRENSRRKSMSG